MLELGYKPLQLWLSPHMQTWLNQAAAEDKIPRPPGAERAQLFARTTPTEKGEVNKITPPQTKSVVRWKRPVFVIRPCSCARARARLLPCAVR